MNNKDAITVVLLWDGNVKAPFIAGECPYCSARIKIYFPIEYSTRSVTCDYCKTKWNSISIGSPYKYLYPTIVLNK